MTWAILIIGSALLHNAVEGIIWSIIRWNLESFQEKLDREWRERRVVEISDTIPF